MTNQDIINVLNAIAHNLNQLNNYINNFAEQLQMKNNDDFSSDYPLGGTIEPYDIEREKKLE